MILSIETVLSRYRLVLFEKCSPSPQIIGKIDSSTDTNINYLFTKLLELSNTNLVHIKSVCIVMGPGSYTGIRVGHSFGLGLSYSCGLPLFSVSTHDLFRYSIKPHVLHSPVLTLIYAREGEAFACLHSVQGYNSFFLVQTSRFKRAELILDKLTIVSNKLSLLNSIDWNVNDETFFVEEISMEALIDSSCHKVLAQSTLDYHSTITPLYQKEVYISQNRIE